MSNRLDIDEFEPPLSGHDGDNLNQTKNNQRANDLLEMSLNDQIYKNDDFKVKDLETSYMEFKN